MLVPNQTPSPLIPTTTSSNYIALRCRLHLVVSSPQILNPKPRTLNPKPQTPSPKP